ncbi:MAG: AAA family ATPase [Candidatus Rokubacteria bacterium]|nr:AAA family ATPase [Candidatus Rokubacteria bacterium]
MYTAHFGLTEAPFSLTPDPRYLYMSERHREALAHLLYGIGQGGGFVQLTGEVGTGKTTVCRCLLEQLPPHVDVALVLNPRLTSLELLATVCDELKIAYPPGATIKTLVDALYRHLLEAHERGRRTVLVIDEAQDLAPEVLEEIRLLTNLETSTEKLLQVILIGQPELVSLLDRPGLRQVAQRVTARYHLTPLSRAETRAYIRHRLEVAGGSGSLFTEAAVREIYRLSRGVPRLINVICDRTLLGAYVEDERRPDARTVRQAGAEVLWGGARRSRLARVGTVAAVLLAAAAIGAGAVLPVSPPRALTALIGRVSGPDRAPAVPASAWPADATRGTPGAAGVTLEGALRDPAPAGQRAAALATLYRRWRPEARDSEGVLACEAGRLRELGCLARTGTWKTLRRLNLPVVLELVLPGGEQRYATLLALETNTAALDVGGRGLTVPLHEVDRYWEGGFLVLWQRPPIESRVMAPGVRGPDVEWLRRRLVEVQGSPAESASEGAFDGALRSRVVAFQRSRSLVPDGVVGAETLIELMAGTAPGVPTLLPARP